MDALPIKSKSLPVISGPCFFAENTAIEGNIHSKIDVIIEGQIYGELRVERQIVIGEKGQVSGHMRSQKVQIYGTFEGIAAASEEIEIWSQATCKAELHVPEGNLIVHQGAILAGHTATFIPRENAAEIHPNSP